MAKAKDKSEAKKPAAKTRAKAPARKSAPAKPAGASIGGATPLIDTSLVAQNAAKLLAAGINLKNKPQQSSKGESSLFKQLKSGLNKPHSAAMDNLLDKTHGPGSTVTKGGAQGFAKQVGHNQTQGSDAARTGVPRRTAG